MIKIDFHLLSIFNLSQTHILRTWQTHRPLPGVKAKPPWQLECSPLQELFDTLLDQMLERVVHSPQRSNKEPERTHHCLLGENPSPKNVQRIAIYILDQFRFLSFSLFTKSMLKIVHEILLSLLFLVK